MPFVFSADGKQLYFCTGGWIHFPLKQSVYTGEIYRVSLDGRGGRLISTKPQHFLACITVGNMLIYDSVVAGFPTQIYRSDLDGKHEGQLTHNTGINVTPALSPDGNTIVFASQVRGIFQLFLMDSHGGNLRQLTHESFAALYPSFSPDGQQIAYDIEDINAGSMNQLSNEGVIDICTIHLDGRGRKALTHNRRAMLQLLLSYLGPLADRLHLQVPVFDRMPSWMPNPGH